MCARTISDGMNILKFKSSITLILFFDRTSNACIPYHRILFCCFVGADVDEVVDGRLLYEIATAKRLPTLAKYFREISQGILAFCTPVSCIFDLIFLNNIYITENICVATLIKQVLNNNNS